MAATEEIMEAGPSREAGFNGMPPQVVLTQMASAFGLSQALYVAAELGVADHLRGGPLSRDELARAVGADPPALYRVLRALGSAGVFAETDDGRLAQTPLSECLVTDAPGSMRAIIRMSGEDLHWRAWGDLLWSVRTGRPSFERAFGSELYKYYDEHPEAAAVYDEAMLSFAAADNAAVVASHDFSRYRKLVDVGGGSGTLLCAILDATPGLDGVLFDLPRAIEGARPVVESLGGGDRCELVSGDFFEAVPAGDAYILKTVIHNWDDERAVKILKNCRRAMDEGGRLLIVEMIMPDGPRPPYSTLLDLEMLVMTPGGRERTRTELAALLAASGFELAGVTPTPSTVSIVEAVPAGARGA